MILKVNSDNNAPKTAPLPFADGELDRFGVRVRPAEFARLMECTKQAVSDWVKSGKITLGPDGRLDPRQAVRQLLRTTDPARMRARVLQPLVRELEAQRRLVGELRLSLARAKEEAEFHQTASEELVDQWNALRGRLLAEWAALQKLPAGAAVSALEHWLDTVERTGGDPGPIATLLAASEIAHESDSLNLETDDLRFP
jgi:hypothetical protein